MSGAQRCSAQHVRIVKLKSFSLAVTCCVRLVWTKDSVIGREPVPPAERRFQRMMSLNFTGLHLRAMQMLEVFEHVAVIGLFRAGNCLSRKYNY